MTRATLALASYLLTFACAAVLFVVTAQAALDALSRIGA